MIGAIAGDIIGSVYEWNNIKTKHFDLFSPNCCFTDDTVLTVALAESILTHIDYVSLMKAYYRRYPGAGYGGFFHQWAQAHDSRPYNSWGNGAAMRISSVGFAFNTLDEVLLRAAEYTAVTHNHKEGIRGAQATAAAIFLARTGKNRAEIKLHTAENFHYDLSRSVDEIRPTYRFNESCQGTVPQAIVCFLESTSFEDAIRNAISLGGDSDTLACITGGIAQAYYGVPTAIVDRVMSILDQDLRSITARFMSTYCPLTTPQDSSM
ncbi:MAG TPA: ADP-ribosylglycohydrolase family protein [Candidatus Acidoferrales bacterium]|nr:ADP-ribosylglycohydrolase family protein [Candidatus Acidoferrales bacterium]